MWLFISRKEYQRFHNVIVPAEDGTTQIDHLLISRYGIFVVETKNMKGWIFGSENQATWTQSLYKRRHTFQNPLRQNYRHVMCLAEYLKLDPSVFHSIVFFIGECTFKTPMPPNVMRDGLSSYIRSFKDPILTDDEVVMVVNQIKVLKSDPSLNHRTHMQSLAVRHDQSNVCPKCGSTLVTRTVKRGDRAGSEFFGCSTFPKCRYVKK